MCGEVRYGVMQDMENDDSEVIKISEWKTPATDYPEKQVNSAKIVHGFYNYGYFHNYGVRGYKYFEVTKQIPVTSLEIKDEKSKIWYTWMVDDPPHFWSMQDYARNSIGRVLVAGLGLGLVVYELLDNVTNINNSNMLSKMLSDVDSITVVERNEDVFAAVAK